jgi:hypothetical protein
MGMYYFLCSGFFLRGVTGLTRSYSNPQQQTNQMVFFDDAIIDDASLPKTRPLVMQGMSTGTTLRPSRRNSLEPSQTFVEGQHIGPTSGVSFLYHAWNRGSDVNVQENDGAPVSAPLASHGDFPQTKLHAADSPLSLPTPERAASLLEHYFRFATPTYRFLHRPTLEDWTAQLLAGHRLSVPKSACVLLVCAQSLLYTMAGDRYVGGGDQDLNTSRVYYQKAKTMLDQEPGPATLASVQARLAMCLYLLSTFRINECRFCFSFASEILKSLGLHRKTSTPLKTDLIDSESRKRTFWCAYVLDGYLSVMLGRPRLQRDEDVDQPLPQNLDDQDMLSSELPENLPLHGNLEAFIWHAGLAKLMGRNNDLLYPLQPLSEEEVLVRTNEMIAALDHWRDTLPEFLKSREKTLAGSRTFERQNTVLKLAEAHLRILATRRCLLTDFSRLGRTIALQKRDPRALKPVQECIAGITTIIGAAYELMQKGALYQAFWFTQYIALVAISTLYVFLIQGARDALPAPIEIFRNVEIYFEKAKQCQRHLAAIAPEGSQARRHHKLLDHLKARVEKDLLRTRNDMPRTPRADKICGTHQFSVQQSSVISSRATTPLGNGTDTDGQTMMHTTQPSLVPQESSCKISDQPYLDLRLDTSGSDGQSLPALQFNPSDDDFKFQNMLDWGWESLDTIGRGDWPRSPNFADLIRRVPNECRNL